MSRGVLIGGLRAVTPNRKIERERERDRKKEERKKEKERKNKKERNTERKKKHRMNERKTVRQVRHVYTVQMFFFFKPIASFIHVYSTCLLPFSKARGLREDWSCGTAGMASFLRLPKSLGMDGGKIMGLWWMNHGFNGLVLREKRAGTRKTPICFVGKIDGFRLRFPQKTNPLR